MPHSSRRPRASSDRYGRGGERAARHRAPAPARHPQPPRPRRAEPHAELDLALDAAAAAPQPAAATFAELGLDDRLVRALAAHDIHEPFAIQARALPDALAGRDVLGRAQTGSGKTLAFGLPLLTRLATRTSPRREKAPRGLVLVPTRELAQQVADALTPLGRSLGVSLTTVYGGVSISRQITLVRAADIVVATPGRLIDLLERRALHPVRRPGHRARRGRSHGRPGLPARGHADPRPDAPGRPAIFFSATLDRGVGRLVTTYIHDPALHAVTSPADSGPADHQVLVLSAQDKVPVAAEIASRRARTLFFVRTKHGADRLAKQLSRAGVEAAAIHGDRNQNQRQRALDAFTAGHPRVLVATDVAARGIHVDVVNLVVQFDPPKDHKDYLHRSGRTARAGATGLVVALVERGQVRELQRLHEAAGVTADRHEVAAGHHVVRQIAASGTPVPPPAPVPVPRRAHPAARRAAGDGRASRPAGRDPAPGTPGGWRAAPWRPAAARQRFRPLWAAARRRTALPRRAGAEGRPGGLAGLAAQLLRS